MSKGLVLITGGAGFIGSHTAAELVQAGYRVRQLDNLPPPVHTGDGTWPDRVPAVSVRVPEEAAVRVFEARDSLDVATRDLPRLLELDRQRPARQRHDFRTPSGGAHPVDGRKRVGQTKDGLERPHREAGRVGDACVAAGVGEDPGHGPSLRP